MLLTVPKAAPNLRRIDLCCSDPQGPAAFRGAAMEMDTGRQDGFRLILGDGWRASSAGLEMIIEQLMKERPHEERAYDLWGEGIAHS